MARSDALPPGDDDEDEEGDDDWVPRGEEDDEDEDDADEGDDGDDDDEGDDGDDDEDEDEDADNAEVEEEDDQSERRPASGPAQHGADNAPRSSRVRERAAPVTPTAPGRTPLRARTPERSARQESSPGAIPPGSDEHIGRRTRAHFSLADKQIAELEALLTTSPTTSPPRSPYTDFLRSLHTMMDEAEAAHAPAGAQLDEEDEEEEDDDYDYLLDRAANGDEDEAEEEFAELVVDEDELVALVEPPRTARGRKRKAAADEATAQGPPADPPAAPAQASVDGGAPADTAVATPVRLHAPPLRRTSPRHVPSGAVCAQPPPSQPPQTAVTALVHTASARAPIEPLAPASALVGSDAGPVPARGWTPEQLRQLQAQLHQHLQVLVHLVLHSRGLLPDKARPQLALTGQPIEAAAVDILQLGRNMLLELRAHAECTLAYKRLRARPCFATPLVAPPGERLLLPRRAGAPPDASGARRGARGPAAAPAHARAPRTATQPWTVFDVPGLEHVQRVVGMIGPIPPPSAGVDAATITDSLRGRPFCHATARRLFSACFDPPFVLPPTTVDGRQPARIFSAGEEKLLAIGLRRYGAGAFEEIQRYLLPSKSVYQLKERVRRATGPGADPIYEWKAERAGARFGAHERAVIRHAVRERGAGAGTWEHISMWELKAFSARAIEDVYTLVLQHEPPAPPSVAPAARPAPPPAQHRRAAAPPPGGAAARGAVPVGMPFQRETLAEESDGEVDAPEGEPRHAPANGPPARQPRRPPGYTAVAGLVPSSAPGLGSGLPAAGRALVTAGTGSEADRLAADDVDDNAAGGGVEYLQSLIS